MKFCPSDITDKMADLVSLIDNTGQLQSVVLQYHNIQYRV